MAEVEDDAPPGVPEWVVTYGDMMSLLLTFFIMLVSLSEMKNDADIRAMLDSIRESFGPSTSLVSGMPGRSLQTNSILSEKYSSGVRSESGVRKANRTSKGPGGANPSVQRINDGPVVSLGGPAMFGPFSADLTDDLTETLTALANVLSERSNLVVIRGHAEPGILPTESGYSTHFELSFQRAKNVADYLAEMGVDRERMILNAAADTEPRYFSRLPERQALNRRVDVFVLDSYTTAN